MRARGCLMAPVDRNRNFNRSLEKFYGNYSKEIKDSLERGTAL